MLLQSTGMLSKQHYKDVAFNAVLANMAYLEMKWGAERFGEGKYSEEKMGRNDFQALKMIQEVKKVIKPFNFEDFNMTKTLKADDGSFFVKESSKIVEYKDGILTLSAEYSCGFSTSEINGKKTMHIYFRGTEPTISKINKDIYENGELKKEYEGIKALPKRVLEKTTGIAEVAHRYFLRDYLNMERHYEEIKPFLDAAMKYAKENNFDEVQVAGHSLGGAMVQKFMDSHPKNKDSFNKKIKGFSFGNPASDHWVQDIMSGVDKVFKPMFKIMGDVGYVAGTIVANATGATGLDFTEKTMQGWAAGISLVKAARLTCSFGVALTSAVMKGVDWSLGYLGMKQPPRRTDDRHITINNESDPIPKAGNLIYNNTGVVYSLPSANPNIEGEGIIRFHSMTNYLNSIMDESRKHGIDLLSDKEVGSLFKIHEETSKKPIKFFNEKRKQQVVKEIQVQTKLSLG